MIIITNYVIIIYVNIFIRASAPCRKNKIVSFNPFGFVVVPEDYFFYLMRVIGLPLEC